MGTADSGDIEADLPDLMLVLGEAAKKPIAILIDELQYLSTSEFSALIMSIHRINQAALPVVMIGAGLPQILGLAGTSKSTCAPTAEGFFKQRVCLKLSDLPTDEVKTALAEILIVQLHGHVLRGEQPRRLTRMLVFDEAHRVKDSKRLEQLAREGRAFGVGIVIGTQFPGDIPELWQAIWPRNCS